MLNFIIANGSTLVVGLGVVVLLASVTIKLIRDKRSGKSSCGGGCAGCPCNGSCHTK